MLPSLPQSDPEPDERAAGVAVARAKYQLNRDFGDLPFPTNVPRQEGPPAYYLLETAKWTAKCKANIAAADAEAMQRSPDGGFKDRSSKYFNGLYDSLQRKIWGPTRDVRIPNWKERTPMSLGDYGMFPLVREPECLHRWKHNWWFARERLAGTNPILIQSITKVPSNVPLVAADYARAMPGDDLETALAEHRVFVVDHSMLEGISAGTGDGYRKWL